MVVELRGDVEPERLSDLRRKLRGDLHAHTEASDGHFTMREMADAAIELANESAFGLGGIVFGSDVEQATEVARQIESGMVYVNGQAETAPDLPFGGVKRSGVGRELGPWGMREFANIKLVHTPKA